MYEKWLKAFHCVATEGSFTAAAERLSVGQSTISTHVKTLEDCFAVELFYRRGRQVELTHLGEHLFAITRSLYGHEEAAIRLLSEARKFKGGQIRLAAIGAFDVIELLDNFRRCYPLVETTVSVSNVNDILTGIHEVRIDVAMIGEEISNPGVHCRFYSRHEVLVIVNNEHRLAKRKKIHLHELEGEDLVQRSLPSTTRTAFENALASAGVSMRPVLEIDSREAMREAVVRGFGIAAITDIHITPHPGIRALRIANGDVFTKIFIVCLEERRNLPVINAFLGTAEEMGRKS